MTKATLRLGPSYHPQGTVEVQILFELPGLPANRFFVQSLTDGKTYTVFKEQLSNIKEVQES